MHTPVLHFVIDPLCGWTYAAGPLMELTRSIENIATVVHGGGMLTGDRSQQVTSQWRDFVTPIDRRIADISGQPFGTKYYDVLLQDNSIVLDSTLPTIAILVAQDIKQLGIDMLNLLQDAYFNLGKNICSTTVLTELAEQLAIDSTTFNRLSAAYQNRIEQHFNNSRHLLQTIQGTGFPSAALEINSQLIPLAISRFYGQPQHWLGYLNTQLTQHRL